TRRLNASQLNSLLMKFFASRKRSCAVSTTCGIAVATLFSSLRAVAWACGIFNSCRSAVHTQRSVSGGGYHSLVSNVFRCRGVHSVLGDVGCVIADSFKTA